MFGYLKSAAGYAAGLTAHAAVKLVSTTAAIAVSIPMKIFVEPFLELSEDASSADQTKSQEVAMVASQEAPKYEVDETGLPTYATSQKFFAQGLDYYDVQPKPYSQACPPPEYSNKEHKLYVNDGILSTEISWPSNLMDLSYEERQKFQKERTIEVKGSFDTEADLLNAIYGNLPSYSEATELTGDTNTCCFAS